MIYQVLIHNLQRARKNNSSWIAPLFLFILIIILFPLTTPHEIKTNPVSSIWIALTLSSLFHINDLFRTDYIDGTIDLYISSKNPLTDYVIGKVLYHWISSCLPLLFLSPILFIILKIDTSLTTTFTFLINLIVSSGCFSLLGTLGAASLLSQEQNNALTYLIILPIFIPIVIFASNTPVQATPPVFLTSNTIILIGLFFIFSASIPWFTAKILKHINSN